mmetsp:Transcript_129001/g.223881  ORF Transcript_129001/g.223881 Transcript_129001/m.223881 type:complete len:426 (+) Transcript_129001:111-1388(+)
MGLSSSKEPEKKELTRGQKFASARITKLENGLSPRISPRTRNRNELWIEDFPLRDAGAETIAEYLKKDYCKCESLYLKHNSIAAPGCAEMASALMVNKTVRYYTLIENKMGETLPKGEAKDNVESGINTIAAAVFGSDSAKKLTDAIKKNVLQIVTLEENCLGNEGAEALAPALQEQDSEPNKLVELTLRRNEIGDKGCISLAKELALNKSLLKFDLQENLIGDDGCVQLAVALQKNTTLKEVNLRANNLTWRACFELSKMLQVNQNLKELNLRRNSLKDEGCVTLAQAFESNSGGLKRLMLSSNLIGDEGTTKLAWALEKNTVLEEVYLEINDIQDKGCIRLAEALEKNNTLQKVNLKMNNFGGDGYNRLADAVNKNKTINTLELSNSLMSSKEPVRKIDEILKPRVKDVTGGPPLSPRTAAAI